MVSRSLGTEPLALHILTNQKSIRAEQRTEVGRCRRTLFCVGIDALQSASSAVQRLASLAQHHAKRIADATYNGHCG
jgi:hypothetical protein